MKVLLCHNYYQIRGGEDLSFEDEGRLLEEHGHQVLRYTRRNDAITSLSAVAVSLTAVWNHRVYREVRQLLRRERPKVVHCTNTFPLLSPALYYAAAAEGVPVVQALRNYRLTCLNSYLMRSGKVCESCIGRRIPWPGVVHACYRDQRLASAAVATLLGVHHALGSWRKQVAVFYTPSQFARDKLVEAGLPAERLFVKQNFVHPDPGAGPGNGNYALFAGRLSAEKGVQLLLDAWRRLPHPIQLRIVGEGPLADQVRSAADASPWIEYLGPRSHGEVLQLMGEAAFVVVSSTWYETFGRIIIEAYAKGTPVVAARLGAMAELVRPEDTGWLFEPGSVEDLAAKISAAIPRCSTANTLRPAARALFLERYTAQANLPLLREIYDRALRQAAMKSRPSQRPS